MKVLIPFLIAAQGIVNGSNTFQMGKNCYSMKCFSFGNTPSIQRRNSSRFLQTERFSRTPHRNKSIETCTKNEHVNYFTNKTMLVKMQNLIMRAILMTLSLCIMANGSAHHGKSFAQSNFETAVRFYDKDLFHAGLNLADQFNVQVRGFYHVTEDLNHWKEIFEEHLMIMDGKRFQSNLFAKSPNKLGAKKNNRLSTGWSSVFDIMDKVHITFEGSTDSYYNLTALFANIHIRSGNEKIELTHFNNSAADSSFNHLSSKDKHTLSEILGEIHTINTLHTYCQEKKSAKQKAFVFYLHNHETHCTTAQTVLDATKDSFVHDIVNSFIVEFPSVCLSALLGGYSSCGVDFDRGQFDSNVWWASCDHVATLERIDTHKVVKELGKVSSSAILRRHGELVHQFIYSKSPEPSGISSSAGKVVAGDSLGDRCAFSFNSKGKEINNHVGTGTDAARDVGSRAVGEDRCSRTGYRFSLIEVLSRLHDDSVLFNNRREGLTNIQTELQLTNRSRFSLPNQCV